MNYIILNGVNSNTITGLIIQELPPISKPLMRTQIDQIDGRDGDIVTKLGYSTVDKELSIGLHGNFDIDSVIEYFASEGTVIFSNEPDKYYRYQVLDQIDFERLVRFRTATVTMHCQPFKYEVNEDPIEEAGSTDTTGDIVTFETQSTDAVGVKVNVEPYQNLNGYDSPWVGGAGRNIIGNFGLNNTPTGGGITATKQVDGSTYVLSGSTSSTYTDVYICPIDNTRSTASGQYGFYTPIDTSINGGQNFVYLAIYNGSTTRYVGVGGTTATQAVTIAEGEVIRGIFIRVGASVNVTGKVIKPMLVKDSNPISSYVPYENICPIYPANGKNILPNNLTWTSGLRDSNGNPTASGTSHYSNSFPCEPNTTYTGQGIKTESTNWRIYFLTADETWISRTEQLTYAEESFTTPSNCYFMQVQCRYTNDLSTNAQIERGNSPTQYVPYNAIGITRTGANLLDNSLTNATVAGVAYTRNADGSITCMGTATNTSSTIQIAPSWKTPYEKGTYILKGSGTNIKVRANTYDINGNLIARIPDSGSGATIVLDDTTVKFSVMAYAGATVAVNETIYPIVTHGTIATSYEPYQGERYYSRDYNFWDGEWESGNIDSSTGENAVSSDTWRSKNYIPVIPSTAYYAYSPTASYKTLRPRFYDADKTYIGYSPKSGTTYTDRSFVTPDNAYYMRFAPNNTDIPNHDVLFNYSDPSQVGYGGTLDVSTGLLTVTHALRNFDNYTGTIAKSSNASIPSGRCVYYINTTDTPWSGGDNNPKGIVMKSSIYDIGSQSYYTMIRKSEFAMGIGSYSGTYCMIGFNVDASLSTVEEFRTWLQSVHCEVWYPLRDERIYQLTPNQVQTLLGVNNIWTDSGTVTVSVPNMISVVNEGNTTAKPTMTIYGSGNVGVWLNGMQVFQIALGDTGNITIDAEQMEAYQGGILRNRLVTGDYSNFVLQKGENTISVTGNVTNVEITNYSRWL